MQSVCVCVQSMCVFVCVCLWQAFYCKLHGLGACLKHCKGGHFRRVFTFKMTCSIRVCVLGGHYACILWGKRKLDPVGATGNHRFGEIRVCAWVVSPHV